MRKIDNSYKLTKFVKAAGWAAKLAPAELSHALSNLTCSNENLLIDLHSNEDAAVFKINEQKAIVQTVDIITPVIDDPYYYGQIAAANSLSDVFAMGGKVLTAMNVVGFDGCNQPKEALKLMLDGAKSKIEECGGTLVGGHTIETPEMLYGLSVTGIIDPNKIYKNNTLWVGDVIILTKPIGLGILTTALKADLIDTSKIEEIALLMSQLNYKASCVMKNYDVSACTDVTGFGLLGHMLEMASDKFSIKVNKKSVPIIDGALEMANMGIIPGGTHNNKSYIEDKVEFASEDAEDIILYDAQTSGGLLISVSKADAPALLAELKQNGYENSAIIGEVFARDKKAISVI